MALLNIHHCFASLLPFELVVDLDGGNSVA